MRVYISSTFEDLREHREAAVRILRQLGHEIVAMEDYVAEGTRPLLKVLDDVRASDVYVGIVAWRYGYVPDTGPVVVGAVAGETSITEYEYRQAVAAKKPILIFLLNERASWPVHLIDREPGPAEALRRLRADLQREHLVSFFETPDGLASQVSAAVSTQGLRSEVQQQLISPLGAQIIEAFTGAGMLTDSHTMPILNLLASPKPERAVVIDISSVWWSTRLYLLAALGQRLGDLQRIIVRDKDGFVGLVSSTTVRNTLRRIHSQANRFESQVLSRAAGSDVGRFAQDCIGRWNSFFASLATGEAEVAEPVTAPNLRLWFGEALQESPVLVQDLESASSVDLLRILDYPNDFVPVQETHVPERLDVRLVDKRELASHVARTSVAEMLDRARMA